MERFDFSFIRTLRRKWNLTAEELAQQAGITRASVANLERGAGNPTIETIEALSGVFQLTASEFIRLAETAKCELAETTSFQVEGYTGDWIRFPNFEAYVIRAEAGVRKDFDPKRHENTAEVCLVLSGKIRAVIGGQAHELGPGMALRFKALDDHHFDVIEPAEFLLIHHNLV